MSELPELDPELKESELRIIASKADPELARAIISHPNASTSLGNWIRVYRLQEEPIPIPAEEAEAIEQARRLAQSGVSRATTLGGGKSSLDGRAAVEKTWYQKAFGGWGNTIILVIVACVALLAIIPVSLVPYEFAGNVKPRQHSGPVAGPGGIGGGGGEAPAPAPKKEGSKVVPPSPGADAIKQVNLAGRPWSLQQITGASEAHMVWQPVLQRNEPEKALSAESPDGKVGVDVFDAAPRSYVDVNADGYLDLVVQVTSDSEDKLRLTEFVIWLWDPAQKDAVQVNAPVLSFLSTEYQHRATALAVDPKNPHAVVISLGDALTFNPAAGGFDASPTVKPGTAEVRAFTVGADGKVQQVAGKTGPVNF